MNDLSGIRKKTFTNLQKQYGNYTIVTQATSVSIITSYNNIYGRNYICPK